MNDVKVNGVDFAARQGSAASSSPPNTVEQQGSNSSGSVTNQQEASRVSGANDVNEVQARTAEASSEAAEQTQERVEDAVTQLNDYVQSIQRDLQFQLDDNSGKTVVTVIDRQTAEVVRQIPDEVALRLAQDLQQDEPLSLFTAKV